MSGFGKPAICGISYALGEIRPLDAAAAGAPPEMLARLRQKGVHSFSRMDGAVPAAITQCVRRTLELAATTPAEIDSVLFVTESFTGFTDLEPMPGHSLVRAHRNLAVDAVAGAGVDDVPMFCSTFGGSSNLLQALFLAKPVLEFTSQKNMLLVCIDRLPPGVSRVMDVAEAVTGDGVATCLLTRQPKQPGSAFEIERVGITPYAHPDRHAGWNQLILQMYRATKAAAADCYEALALTPADYAWMILSNYNILTCRVFARLLGIGLERTFMRNAARAGHIPGCDPLINLRDLADETHLAPGTRILMYGNGPISCGTVSLRVR